MRQQRTRTTSWCLAPGPPGSAPPPASTQAGRHACSNSEAHVGGLASSFEGRGPTRGSRQPPPAPDCARSDPPCLRDASAPISKTGPATSVPPPSRAGSSPFHPARPTVRRLPPSLAPTDWSTTSLQSPLRHAKADTFQRSSSARSRADEVAEHVLRAVRGEALRRAAGTLAGEHRAAAGAQVKRSAAHLAGAATWRSSARVPVPTSAGLGQRVRSPRAAGSERGRRHSHRLAEGACPCTRARTVVVRVANGEQGARRRALGPTTALLARLASAPAAVIATGAKLKRPPSIVVSRLTQDRLEPVATRTIFPEADVP